MADQDRRAVLARNPANERQVVVALTPKSLAIRNEAGCLGQALLEASGESPQKLGALNHAVRDLRDAIYAHIGGWSVAAAQDEK
jgi:DNA-binding MarR family transcriptional regulator